jgi:hypothetical protein
MSDAADTLLGYVPELLAEIERLQGEADAARDDERRIRTKIDEAELAIMKRRAELVRPDRSRVLAEAALAGAAPPPEPQDPPGAPIAELEATARGLKQLQAEAVKRREDRVADVRAALCRLFPLAAERAAVDYAKHAKAVANLHAAIGAAQEGAQAVPGRTPWEGVFVGGDWSRLFVPISEQLEALRPYVRPHANVQVLAGGSVEECGNAARQAFERVKAEITRRLGRWPHDKGL